MNINVHKYENRDGYRLKQSFLLNNKASDAEHEAKKLNQ